MGNKEVKVGQVWEDSRDGETFYVQKVKRSAAVGTGFDGARHYMSITDDGIPYSPTWTLIQDVSTEAPNVDTSAERVDAVCHCEGEGYAPTAYAYHGIEQCANRLELVLGTPCPPRVAPKDEQDAKYKCPACPPSQKVCPVPKPKPKPVGPCTALRASLPKSGEFVESACDPNPDKYGFWFVTAGSDAKADLRRQVASMRSWPCCPVSKEPLRIEAKVAKSSQVLPAKDGYRMPLHETINTWHAEFTCDCCGRGGK